MDGRGWPGSCHEHELLALSGLGEVLDAADVASLLDRGFRGLAKGREHWHAPVGDRRTKDRLSDAQRMFNRLQAGLRALVEQVIAHLANAWSMRRWRGLLYRVRDVFRAADALEWDAGPPRGRLGDLTRLIPGRDPGQVDQQQVLVALACAPGQGTVPIPMQEPPRSRHGPS
ncbi:MAG: superfamily endonuclease [Actinomycetia bacterium]|nr:superfamily endonuclease [Actinomycetes bacterium]